MYMIQLILNFKLLSLSNNLLETMILNAFDSKAKQVLPVESYKTQERADLNYKKHLAVLNICSWFKYVFLYWYLIYLVIRIIKLFICLKEQIFSRIYQLSYGLGWYCDTPVDFNIEELNEIKEEGWALFVFFCIVALIIIYFAFQKPGDPKPPGGDPKLKEVPNDLGLPLDKSLKNITDTARLPKEIAQLKPSTKEDPILSGPTDLDLVVTTGALLGIGPLSTFLRKKYELEKKELLLVSHRYESGVMPNELELKKLEIDYDLSKMRDKMEDSPIPLDEVGGYTLDLGMFLLDYHPVLIFGATALLYVYFPIGAAVILF